MSARFSFHDDNVGRRDGHPTATLQQTEPQSDAVHVICHSAVSRS